MCEGERKIIFSNLLPLFSPLVSLLFSKALWSVKQSFLPPRRENGDTSSLSWLCSWEGFFFPFFVFRSWLDFFLSPVHSPPP